MHIIEECIRSFYLAYIVKKGSALYPPFSQHVQHLFEGGEHSNLAASNQNEVFFDSDYFQLGFVSFWHNFIEYGITTHRRYIPLTTIDDQGPLSLIDLQIAFFILFIGFCFSFLLLFAEILIHRHQQHNKMQIWQIKSHIY